MERPERPSRHSKTHDKWKRIIEPSGDSDSSSDWSTENELVLNRPYYDGAGSGGGGASGSGGASADGAGPSTSIPTVTLADARESLRARVRSLVPNHDLSSLLARYSTERHKRPAPAPTPPDDGDDEPGADPPAYHLLHHDYAERDAEHDYFRDLQGKPLSTGLRLSAARLSASRSGVLNSENFFYVPGGERKRSRLHRHLLNPAVEPLEPRMNMSVDPEDIDQDLYVMRSPVARPDNTTLSDDMLDDSGDEVCRPPIERARPEVKLKFVRRGVSAGGDVGAGGAASGPTPAFQRSFYDLTPLSERSAAAVAAAAAARHDAASGSSAEVQVISMAGPSGNRTPPRAADRPAERPAAGDDEIIVIVEDQQSPAAEPQARQTASSSSIGLRGSFFTFNKSQPVSKLSATPPSLAIPLPPPIPLSTAAASSTASSAASTSAPSAAGCGDSKQSLNEDLISLLECPVCTEYMVPPIHQCRRGHLLCAVCKPKLPQCPTCRSRFTDSRNLAMEQVADRLLYPCKNRELEAGCTAQLRLKDKLEHEGNCEFRAFQCSLAPCEWKGLKDALFGHSLTVHRDVLLLGSKQELLVNVLDLQEVVSRDWLISAFDELFRVNFVSPKRGQPTTPGSTPQRQHVLGCVQFIGPRSGANRYKYTIETRRDGANRCLRYTRNVHSDLSRCASIYLAVDCFHVRGETAEIVCVRRDGAFHLPVVVTISLN